MDSCKNDWQRVYYGFMMSQQKNGLSSGSICVDVNPATSGVVNDSRSPQYSFVRTGGAFSTMNQLIPCILCSKR